MYLCETARTTFNIWLDQQESSPSPDAVSPTLPDNACWNFMDRIASWVGIYNCGIRDVLSTVDIDPSWCIEIQFDAPNRDTNFANNNINLFYQVCNLFEYAY